MMIWDVNKAEEWCSSSIGQLKMMLERAKLGEAGFWRLRMDTMNGGYRTITPPRFFLSTSVKWRRTDVKR